MLDEAQYWTWSRELAFGYFSKPPMIAWVIRGATAICGDGEACIRSASPVLHTLASVRDVPHRARAVRRRVGFWSAIVFDTLPGVSYSSLLITTDVPLILFWTIALYVLGDAGEAAKHGLRRPVRCRDRARSPRQAGDDLRRALRRLSRACLARGAGRR